MKKIITIVLCVLLLTSCSGGNKNSQLNSTEVKLGNNVIKLNQDISDVTKVLGDDYSLEVSKSCMFDGDDKIFTYKDLIINTYPQSDNGKDLINAITIKSKDVQLFKDVHIGDKIDDAKKVMGEEPVVDDEDICTYEFEKSGITFYLEDGTISEIEIFLIQE